MEPESDAPVRLDSLPATRAGECAAVAHASPGSLRRISGDSAYAALLCSLSRKRTCAEFSV